MIGMARVAGKSYLFVFVSRRVAPFSRLFEQSQHGKLRHHHHDIGCDSLCFFRSAIALTVRTCLRRPPKGSDFTHVCIAHSSQVLGAAVGTDCPRRDWRHS